MKENKYAWHVLLKRFVDNVINEEERVELYRQMGECSLKREQFDQVTEPNYFRNILLDCLIFINKGEEDLLRFEKKLDAICKVRKGY